MGFREMGKDSRGQSLKFSLLRNNVLTRFCLLAVTQSALSPPLCSTPPPPNLLFPFRSSQALRNLLNLLDFMFCSPFVVLSRAPLIQVIVVHMELARSSEKFLNLRKSSRVEPTLLFFFCQLHLKRYSAHRDQ